MKKSSTPPKITPKKLHINEAIGCLAFVLIAQTISYQWLLSDGFAAELIRGIASFNPYLNDKFISFADHPKKYSTTHTLSIIFAPVFLLIFFKNYQKPQPTSIGKRIISVTFLVAIFFIPILIDPTKGKRLSRIIFDDGIVGVLFGMSTSMLIAAAIVGIISVFFESYTMQGEKQ